METIQPQHLYKTLESMLMKYQDKVENLVVKETQAVVKKVKPELKAASTSHTKNTYVKGSLYRSGVYQTGWRYRTVTGEHRFQIKTYNAKKPSIVHLLEFGHGGPVKSPAYPHVRAIELKHLQELQDRLERGVIGL